MNFILWILQVLLALYNVAGGVYMVGHYKILAYASAVKALPAPVWTILGVLQIVFALGLVLPGIFKTFVKLIPISAIGLIIISLLGSVLYVSYAGSGILWAVIPAILLAFIAYGRRLK